MNNSDTGFIVAEEIEEIGHSEYCSDSSNVGVAIDDLSLNSCESGQQRKETTIRS